MWFLRRNFANISLNKEIMFGWRWELEVQEVEVEVTLCGSAWGSLSFELFLDGISSIFDELLPYGWLTLNLSVFVLVWDIKSYAYWMEKTMNVHGKLLLDFERHCWIQMQKKYILILYSIWQILRENKRTIQYQSQSERKKLF